ncbi:uncharacterized protein EAF02_009120 [Botrytis sinoallii]|uniref:uncharacterized protein n=1 Tax=Botrytis sinoallii TaxID=1463999 RepID=UPI0018FF69BB|nr:uncharacterized protein EAF02_009120 [Botrytis sinoallii]KAF7872015.1 hypothetical protein EAF02_009120 [Botrytis sinoallii]
MFTCEHIINYLHARIIRELDKNDITTGLSTADKEKGGTDLIFEIRKCLKHMPRMIQLTHGHNNGELRVSWEDSEAEDTASNDETADIANCGCPQKIVSSTSSDNEITFAGLVSTESYFPKISRAKVPIAFFGFPPSPIKPTSNKPQLCLLPASDADSNEDLPVQENRLDKALNIILQRSLRDRMSYDTTSIEAQLEKSESCRRILRQDVEKASSKIKELKSNSNTLRIEKESLSKQLTNALLEKARLTQSLQQLKTQRMSNSAKPQANTDAFSVRIADLNVKNADLEEDLRKTRKSHAAQAVQLETFKKERDVMKSENATLQEKLSDSQMKNSTIKSSAIVDLKEAHARIGALEKRDVKMKIDIRQLKTDQEILEKRISQANSQIKRANMGRDKAMIEKNTAIAERDEAIMQKNKSLRKQRKFKSLMQSELERDESSDEGSRYVSGIKRDRSLDPSERDVVNDGVGNGNGSRSVKKVKRETPKIIVLE